MIYFDSAAAARPLPCALSALNSVLTGTWGNPNSSHAVGEAARKILDASEAKIRACIGAKSGRLYFFPTATAAAQTAIFSLTEAGYIVRRNPTEHHSILERTIAEKNAYTTRRCAYPASTSMTAYATQLANNETGAILPKPVGTPWLCDATAAMGHIPIDVEQLGASYVVADALKFGGIPGAAFLWVADGAPYTPLVEGGTFPVALIAAMAAALEWHTEHMDENTKKLEVLQKQFYYHLSEIPKHKWNTPMLAPHLPHILNISFSGVDGKALALLCSKRGVMISAGAACTSGNNEPSHVLMAMCGDEARARSAVRISFSHENTVEEAEQAAKTIAECVAELRAMS